MHTNALIDTREVPPTAMAALADHRPASCRFCDPERLVLLRTPGLGPTVVSRLEAQGLSSLQAMRDMGVERVVELVCRAVGSSAWKNRHAALVKALSAATMSGETCPRARCSQTPDTPTAD
jgi:hypothetical protein